MSKENEEIMSLEMIKNLKIMIGEYNLPIKAYDQVVPPLVSVLNGLASGKYKIIENPDFNKDEK